MNNKERKLMKIERAKRALEDQAETYALDERYRAFLDERYREFWSSEYAKTMREIELKFAKINSESPFKIWVKNSRRDQD